MWSDSSFALGSSSGDASGGGGDIKTRLSPVSSSSNSSPPTLHSSVFTHSSSSLSSLHSMTLTSDVGSANNSRHPSDEDLQNGSMTRNRLGGGASIGSSSSSKSNLTLVSDEDSASSSDPTQPISIDITTPTKKVATAVQRSIIAPPPRISPSKVKAISSASVGRSASTLDTTESSKFEVPLSDSYTRFKPLTPPAQPSAPPSGLKKLKLMFAANFTSCHVLPLMAAIIYLLVVFGSFLVPHMLEAETARSASGVSTFGSLSVFLAPAPVWSPFLSGKEQNQLRIDLKNARCSRWMESWWPEQSWRSALVLNGAQPSHLAEYARDAGGTASTFGGLLFAHAYDMHSPYPTHPRASQQNLQQHAQQYIPHQTPSSFDQLHHPEGHHLHAIAQPVQAYSGGVGQQQPHGAPVAVVDPLDEEYHRLAQTQFDLMRAHQPQQQQHLAQNSAQTQQQQQHHTQQSAHSYDPYYGGHDTHGGYAHPAQQPTIQQPLMQQYAPSLHHQVDPLYQQQQQHPQGSSMHYADPYAHLQQAAMYQAQFLSPQQFQQQQAASLESEYVLNRPFPNSVGDVEAKLKERMMKAKQAEEDAAAAAANQKKEKEKEQAKVTADSSMVLEHPTVSTTPIAEPESEPQSALLRHRREKEKLKLIEKESAPQEIVNEPARSVPVAPPTRPPTPSASMHSSPSHFGSFRLSPLSFYIGCSISMLLLPWIGVTLVLTNFLLSIVMLLRFWWHDRQIRHTARASSKPHHDGGGNSSREESTSLLRYLLGQLFSRCKKRRGMGSQVNSIAPPRPLPEISIARTGSVMNLSDMSWLMPLAFCLIGGVPAYLLQRRAVEAKKRGQKSL